MATMDRITADKCFEEWGEAWELDFEVDTENKEQASMFASSKKTVINAFMKGRLAIEGETLKFTPSAGGHVFSIEEPTGATYTELDSGKENQNVAKLNKLMGSMCKTTAANITTLKGRDYKTLMAIANLFMIG